MAYAFKGSKELALTEAEKLGIAHSPVFAGTERRRNTLVFLEDLKTKAKKQYVDAVKVASQYAQFGDNEEALKWLDQGYQIRSADMVHLKVSPFLGPLRSDPRFQDLLRCMNFPP